MSTTQVRRLALSAGEIDCGILGSGPPVVFLPPLLASSRHWRKVLPIVAGAGFQCVAPTLPLGAHHHAMRTGADVTPPAVAELVAELLSQLNLGPVTLVGNDSGGALAQIVAARHPEIIDRLVSIIGQRPG